MGLAQNPGALFVGIGTAEIAEQAGAQLLRFPDIHDFAVGRDHPVHGGTILGALAHIRQHLDNASLRRARSEEV